MAKLASSTSATAGVNAPSQRQLLGSGALAALTGAGFAAVVLSPDPVWGEAERRAGATLPDADAALLQLGLDLTAAWRAEGALWQAVGAASEADEDRLWEQASALSKRTEELVDRIRDISATTLPGVLVKVRALHWCRSGNDIEEDDIDPDGVTTDMALVTSLVRDLGRMTERTA